MPEEIRVKKLKIGSINASGITEVVIYNSTIDPASVAANTIAAQTFTVKGLTVGDKLIVNPGVNTIGVAGAYASAADTLTVIFVNPTAGAIDAASSIWRIMVFRG